MYINKKNLFVTIGIIVGVVLIAFIILYLRSLNYSNPSEEIVECIGEKAILYVQEGCSHCLKQEEKFGERYGLLNVVDCTKTPERCINASIVGVPSWEINGTLYKGVYEIDELKNMTGCV